MNSAVPAPKIPAPATTLASEAVASHPSSPSARLMMRYSPAAKTMITASPMAKQQVAREQLTAVDRPRAGRSQRQSIQSRDRP